MARTWRPVGPGESGAPDLVADVVDIVAQKANLAVTAEYGTDFGGALACGAVEVWSGTAL